MLIEYTIPLYLAATSRLHGSNSPTPKILEAGLYAVPYCVLVYLVSGNPYLSIAALVASGAAKNIGTREGFRGYTKDNWLSKVSCFLVEKLDKERNSVWGDVIYNTLKGALIVALPAVIIAFYNPVTATAIYLSGMIGNALGYELAYYLRQRIPYLQGKYKTYIPVGEWMTGFFAGLGFLL